jgi:CcmD family protein
MYKKVKALFSLFVAQLLSLSLWAQGDTSGRPVEMADKFRADGKIYVVIVVVLVILSGIFIYVARLDRKITRFEKEIK